MATRSGISSSARRTPRRRRAGTSRLARAFLVAFGVLLCLRLLLPPALRAYVNRVLNDIPGYSGHIEKLDLNLWRGAYEIEGLVVQRATGAENEPFLEAQRLDLSIAWAGLLRGKLVGEAELQKPVVTFVAARSKAESQTGEDAAWPKVLDALFPFGIQRFVLQDGELRFQRITTDPPVDLYITDFYLEARDIAETRGRASDDPLTAEAEAAGRPLGTGELEARLRFDPKAESPRFELDASLRGIALVDLNDFLRAYGRVDAESGSFEMYAEFAASDGEVEGYVKTLVEDADIVSTEEIEGPQDLLEAFWEGLVEFGAELLENQPHGRVAARIPLRGTIDAVDADLSTTIASLLRNAFIAALRPAIDDSIELTDLEVAKSEGRARDRERAKRRGGGP